MSLISLDFKSEVEKKLMDFLNRFNMPLAFTDLIPTTSITGEKCEDGNIIYKQLHVHLRPTIIYHFKSDEVVAIKAWLRAEYDFEAPYYKSNDWIYFEQDNLNYLNEIMIEEFNDQRQNNIERTKNHLNPPNFYLSEVADYSKQNTYRAMLYNKEHSSFDHCRDIEIIITNSEKENNKEIAIYDIVRNGIIIKANNRSQVYNDGKPYIVVRDIIGRSIYIEDFNLYKNKTE